MPAPFAVCLLCHKKLPNDQDNSAHITTCELIKSDGYTIICRRASSLGQILLNTKCFKEGERIIRLENDNFYIRTDIHDYLYLEHMDIAKPLLSVILDRCTTVDHAMQLLSCIDSLLKLDETESVTDVLAYWKPV